MTNLEQSAQEMNHPREVFVVHGRNHDVRDAMFDFLRALDLKPMEWDRAVALTGEASPYIGQVLDAAFNHAQAVVVLMTPDEVAYMDSKWSSGEGDDQTEAAAQARPNVLFEAGMAMGRNPKRTVLVEVGELRAFSDLAGRHAVRLSNSAASRQALATRLANAGCAVDTSNSDWHTKGDFTVEQPGGGYALGKRVPVAKVSRPPIEFALRFQSGPKSNSLDKLTVINRGTETATNVNLVAEEGAAIDLRQAELPIEKIPGNGHSVTVRTFSMRRLLGTTGKAAFDITITCTREDGAEYSQVCFLDMNG